MTVINNHVGVLYIASQFSTAGKCEQTPGHIGRCYFIGGFCYCVHNGLLLSDIGKGSQRKITMRHWRLSSNGQPCMETVIISNIIEAHQIMITDFSGCHKFNKNPQIVRGNTIGVAYDNTVKNGVFAFWYRQNNNKKYCDFSNGNKIVQQFSYFHYDIAKSSNGTILLKKGRPYLQMGRVDLVKPIIINSAHKTIPTGGISCG